MSIFAPPGAFVVSRIPVYSQAMINILAQLVGRRGTNKAQSRPDLDWYLDVFQKHTTVDSAPACLVEGLSLRWFILGCEYCISISEIHAHTCYQPHVGNESPILENLLEISWNPSPISRFLSPKIQFSSHEIQFSPISFLLSSMAFRFLQWLSAFFNIFPLSSMAFRFSSTAFQFSSTAFLFPRNPRKSIYGGKYTKGHYSGFVFPATCSPSFVITTCSPSFVITTRSLSFVIATCSPSFVIATMPTSHPTHSCGAPVLPTVPQI